MFNNINSIKIMTQATIENVRRYINEKIDIAQMIFDKTDEDTIIDIRKEVDGGVLVITIDYTIEREFYSIFSADNLTPPEQCLRDWSFSLDSQYWGWIDEDGEEHDITSEVELDASELEGEIDKLLTYYY